MSVFDKLITASYFVMFLSGVYLVYTLRHTFFSRYYPITRALTMISGVLGFYGLALFLLRVGVSRWLDIPYARDTFLTPVVLLAGTMVYISYQVKSRIKALKERGKE